MGRNRNDGGYYTKMEKRKRIVILHRIKEWKIIRIDQGYYSKKNSVRRDE